MKVFKIFGSVAIATIVGINGYIAFDDGISASNLNVTNVEAMANPPEEPTENPFWLKFIYGDMADEYHIDYPCQIVESSSNWSFSFTNTLKIKDIEKSETATVSYNGGTIVTYPGHFRVCYDNGTENCWSYSCKKGSQQ